MSTLHVENLKGLSSGGNANKIIVPSGQTLHAAGHVVQVAQYSNSTVYSNSTTSAVQAMQTGTFTLTNSSNKVLVTLNCLTRSVRSSAAGTRISLYRGAVSAGTRITNGSEPQNYATDAGSEIYQISYLQALDTPSAATVTYSLGFWKHSSGSSSEIRGDHFQTTIILQEVAA